MHFNKPSANTARCKSIFAIYISQMIMYVCLLCFCMLYTHFNDANHKGKLMFNLCLYIASIGTVNKHVKLAFLTMYFFFGFHCFTPHLADNSCQ